MEDAELRNILFSIQGSIAGFQNDMSDVKNDIADMKTDITNMKTDITNMKADITNMKSDIVQLKGSVKTIELKLENEIDRKECLITEDTYQIIIDCDSEEDMQNKYESIRKVGIDCRISTL